jgi:hypothetical protein
MEDERTSEGAAAATNVCSCVWCCRRFVVLPVMYGTTLSLTQTVPVPGTRSGFWWEKTRTMMAHAPSLLRLALPRLTRRPGLPMMGSLLSTASPGYGCYLTGVWMAQRSIPGRDLPIYPLSPLVLPSLPEPTKQNTARDPYRALSALARIAYLSPSHPRE